MGDGYLGCTSAPGSCLSDFDCGPGMHCSNDDAGAPAGCGLGLPCPVFPGVCVPDGTGQSCYVITDERTCIDAPGCQPVYAGSRCFCDAQGCGCLDYSFASCRPHDTPVCERVAGVIGSWTSTDDAIPRTYAFAPDGTFTVTDAVARCPPGADCIWSGLVVEPGKWFTESDGSIDLVYPMIQPWPGLSYPTDLTQKGCYLVEDATGRTFERHIPID
jgi:hypothetical protein